jgi:hypothetical protein
MVMTKCTSFAGRFDGHADAMAMVRYRAHWLMANIQGFAQSHWMPLLGECVYCLGGHQGH